MTPDDREREPDDLRFDFDRRRRIGLPEAVLCAGKSAEQLARIIAEAGGRAPPLLLTRLTEAAFAALPPALAREIDYDPISRTGIFGPWRPPGAAARVAIVSAGTGDYPVAREAARVLAFHGEAARELNDVGVAGLWRMLEREEELRRHRVLIAVAGMDGALFSVLGGLMPGVVIAVPTSTGYGMARGGETALHSALTSCAPGLLTVNIDNGYGAATAALRVLGAG